MFLSFTLMNGQSMDLSFENCTEPPMYCPLWGFITLSRVQQQSQALVTTAHQGSVAVISRIVTQTNVLNQGTVNVSTPFMLGDLGQLGVPISTKPGKLFGWYMFNGFNLDTAFVRVFMKQGQMLIGSGEVNIFAPTPTYSQFTVNIYYTNSATPDHVLIIMGFKTYNSTLSYFIVDDLNFDVNVDISAVSNQIANHSISLSPNPSSDFCLLNIHIDNELEDAIIEVRNLLGEVIIADEVENYSQYSISTTNFPSGVYFVRLNTRNGFYFEKKLIIVR